MEKYFADKYIERHAIAMALLSIRMNCMQPELNKEVSHQDDFTWSLLYRDNVNHLSCRNIYEYAKLTKLNKSPLKENVKYNFKELQEL